jgi:plasmid maintenance system antidote protein VapI
MEAKELRRKLAESDILIAQFAELTGVNAVSLSHLLHERRAISPEMAARLEVGLDRLEQNPPARLVVPRTRRKLEEAAS